MGVGTTPGDRPVEDGAGYADERAASLRRMFPSRPGGSRPFRALPPESRPSLAPSPEPRLFPAPSPEPRPFLAPPPASRPLPSPPPPPPLPASPPAPPRRRGRYLAFALVVVLAAVGAAVALRLRAPGPAEPPVEVAKGFPAVTRPSIGRPSAPPPSRGAGSSANRPAGTITGYSACSTAYAVTFKATFSDGFVYRHVFIDTDGDASTGYRIEGIAGGFGADYLLENDTFLKSTGANWAWEPIERGTPLISDTGGTHIWKVRPDHGGVRAVFNGSDGGTTETFSPIVPVKKC
ncbi:hypothetical protein [Actinoplanes utahensis]|uniref:hypothetical protein n=1 Tax=Actinoplanes utahensis TaxID=1869 RepID=UPI001269DF88|nr:hypothetical protein [Actinoplanes utahensis]